MHILVTGKEGQVAQALLNSATSQIRVTAIGRPSLDITDKSSVFCAIRDYKPDIIVNAAAYTAVDKAESNRDLAFAVNCDGAQNVAEAANLFALPIIQISTDYVFSGVKTAAYIETDATEPNSIYGHSKLAGEHAVALANSKHFILRTAWVYSTFGNNFLKTMLKLARDRDVIRVVNDQHGSPTHAEHIAAGILSVARKALQMPNSKSAYGTFHMVDSGKTNWADFADEIFRCSSNLGGPAPRIERIATHEYETVAKRPMNSVLNTMKFNKTFDTALPFWKDGIMSTVASILSESLI